MWRLSPYVTAPPLPDNFVDRLEVLKALRNALITDGDIPLLTRRLCVRGCLAAVP
jgi:hypothetical protein